MTGYSYPGYIVPKRANFTYAARLEYVYDGDTVTLCIMRRPPMDLGFGEHLGPS